MKAVTVTFTKDATIFTFPLEALEMLLERARTTGKATVKISHGGVA